MLHKKLVNEKDVKYILDNLRKEDVLEVQAVHGENWKEIELNEILNTDSYTVIGADENNTPICIGGLYEVSDGVGVVWFLSTDDIKKHKLSMLKHLQKEFESFDKDYWFLYNLIYKSNNLAKNWLKWIGFKFDMTKPVGMNIPDDFEFFYRIKKMQGLLG